MTDADGPIATGADEPAATAGDEPRAAGAAPKSFQASLGEALPDLVRGGIASRPLFRAPGCKVTLFRFDAGQGMTEHTSGHAATLQLLEGRMRVQVGEHTVTLLPGSFLGLEPRVPHSLDALEPALLLLTVMAP
jgi:quercetin dioxygenase-like cupin family protein